MRVSTQVKSTARRELQGTSPTFLNWNLDRLFRSKDDLHERGGRSIGSSVTSFVSWEELSSERVSNNGENGGEVNWEVLKDGLVQ